MRRIGKPAIALSPWTFVLENTKRCTAVSEHSGTKLAVPAISQSLRQEFGAKVRVTSIEPTIGTSQSYATWDSVFSIICE